MVLITLKVSTRINPIWLTQGSPWSHILKMLSTSFDLLDSCKGLQVYTQISINHVSTPRKYTRQNLTQQQFALILELMGLEVSGLELVGHRVFYSCK